MLLLKTVPCSSTTLLFRTFIWFSLKSKTKSLCVFFKHVESTVLKSESFWLHFCDWCLLETLAVNPDYRCKCGTLDKEQTWQGAFCSCLGSAEKLWGQPLSWSPLFTLRGEYIYLGKDQWLKYADSIPAEDFRRSYFSPLCFIAGEFPQHLVAGRYHGRKWLNLRTDV